MNAVTAEKTLHYVKGANALAKRALDDRNVFAADREKAAAGRDQFIAEMLDCSTIGYGQQEKAAEMLGTHAGTSTLLKSAIAKIAELSKTQKQASALGEGVDDSIVSGAGPEARNDNYVGERTSEKKASDEALFAGLGITTGAAG